MKFKLSDLPYPKNALEPYVSQKTIEFHYGKHHKGYMDKLETAIADTEEAELTLEEVIRTTDDQTIFNLAAQVWNHDFFWRSMSPEGGGTPPDDVTDILREHFGSLDQFREAFSHEATSHFGSGWVWLIADTAGELKVISTHDADTPLTTELKPLLTLDVWEHAYYLDYQNDRAKFVKTFLDHLINWRFILENLAGDPDDH